MACGMNVLATSAFLSVQIIGLRILVIRDVPLPIGRRNVDQETDIGEKWQQKCGEQGKRHLPPKDCF